MPTALDKWDSVWYNDVTNKEYSLKQWIDHLDNRESIHTTMGHGYTGDIAALKDTVKELLLYHKLRMMYELEKIDKNELRRLYTMLASPDEKNHTLVHELINSIK